MTITKITRKPTADEFISAAPDATIDKALAQEKKYVQKGKKLQISLTISRKLLEQVEQLAEQLGLSRTAIINLAIQQSMANGISVDKLSLLVE